MTTKKNLSELKEAVAESAAASGQIAAQERVQQLDKKGRAYGTGRRKDAVARVWVSRGNGKITVNGRDIAVFFARGTQRLVINQPFEVTARVGQFDVNVVVSGGGLTGQ